jgi:hypothetical protein
VNERSRKILEEKAKRELEGKVKQEKSPPKEKITKD